jgi:hypothetical protein
MKISSIFKNSLITAILLCSWENVPDVDQSKGENGKEKGQCEGPDCKAENGSESEKSSDLAQ